MKYYKFFITILFCFCFFEKYTIYNIFKKKTIKVALCTMGKKENLYAQQFMEYYIRLGVDHMFIYDNNDPYTENIIDVMDTKYKDKISFYKTKKYNIYNQKEAFTHCYMNNLKKFDFFIMVDMDEYLYIINDSLKNYLNNQIFEKCDFIKIHWANSQDNNLLHYDSRPLFQRFKRPYIKSKYIKTNTNKAYLIHFRFKSTEEFINKYKRGYSNWHRNNTNKILLERLATYFEENGITLEKIE